MSKNRGSGNQGNPSPPRAIATLTHEAHSFSGPIPPPGLLEKYNEVIPNGADRIMAMAERQSAHRESLEAQVVAGNVRSQERGTLYAFILCAIALIGGFTLLVMGKDVTGLVSIVASLSALV